MEEWKFVAVTAKGAAGFAWQWQKVEEGRAVKESTKCFDYYYECVQDARTHGYDGTIGQCPPRRPDNALLER